MPGSKKSRLAGIGGAIGIAVLAFFMIFALNSLQWPIASSLGSVVSIFPSPAKVPDGILEVYVQSNMTVIPLSAEPSYPSYGLSSSAVENLAGINVDVYLSSGVGPIVSNVTGPGGSLELNLAPNNYSVRLVDWRLDNLTVNLQVSSDKVTDLNATVNAMSYVIESASISDPDFAGYATSWGQIYVLVDSNQSINAKSPETFLDAQYPAFTPLYRIDQQDVVPIVVVGTSDRSNYTQWIQIRVDSPLSIGNIRSMSILTLRSQYAVSTSDIQ